MALKENCSPVRVGVSVKVTVSFRVGKQPDNCSEENCTLVRVRIWVSVNFGTIFLGGNCPRFILKVAVEIFSLEID